MYDADEEIKRKRRRLIILITIVILLIIGLSIFLIYKFVTKKQTKFSCELEIKDGVKPDANGVYHQGVTVGFKEINTISGNKVIKQVIGTSDNSKNKETFTVSHSGKYHLYGFIQDSAGNKETCEINFEVSLKVPSCELEVTQGTLGDNNWYKSNVEVGFKSMNTNNDRLEVKQYYIEKESSGSTPPTGNVDKYTVTDDSTTTLVGHVIDSAGNDGTCKITISKDSSVPTCSLKVNSGNKDANGVYTDNPVIGIDKAEDSVSQIAYKGVGVSKNYSESTYQVTGEGKTTVYGYVKDKAGNEGTCSIDITRPSSTPQPQPTPEPAKKQSVPHCDIRLDNIEYDSNGNYAREVKAVLIPTTTNNAVVIDYGIAESQTYNQRKEITISSDGPHTVYGVVKDSYGNTASCATNSFVIEKSSLLNTVGVKPGQYVSYDAGTWSQTKTEQGKDAYAWGMTAGASKQTGVRCNSSDGSPKNGWIVLGSSGKSIVIISAGTPECIYHTNTSPTNLINVMSGEAQSYVNQKYAYGSDILQCGTVGFECNRDTYSTYMFKTGYSYWTVHSNGVFGIDPNGNRVASTNKSLGLRPIIYLRPDVRTTGLKGNTWILK